MQSYGGLRGLKKYLFMLTASCWLDAQFFWSIDCSPCSVSVGPVPIVLYRICKRQCYAASLTRLLYPFFLSWAFYTFLCFLSCLLFDVIVITTMISFLSTASAVNIDECTMCFVENGDSLLAHTFLQDTYFVFIWCKDFLFTVFMHN